MKNNYKVIIIGGGAAGMICAIGAKQRDILILEASPRLGKKLLATGNGKCNLLNKRLDGSFYNDAEFAAQVFARYDEKALENFYTHLGLMLRFDAEGRGYPLSESANTVLDVLRRALENEKVEIKTDTRVTGIKKVAKGFELATDNGAYFAEKVVLATGSDAGFGLDSLGLLDGIVPVKPFTPSLAPLIVNQAAIKGLNGVRVKCRASLISGGKTVAEERGEVLFKTFALSGIATFNLSAAYVRAGCPDDAYISLDFLECDKQTAQKLFSERRTKRVDESLEGVLHKMLAQAVAAYAGLTPNDIVDNDASEALAKACTDYRIKIEKVADKSLAQVMQGGVSTAKINARTLEASDVKNLYFAGEAVDIDGLSGGYNLSWAAASALVVADSLI